MKLLYMDMIFLLLAFGLGSLYNKDLVNKECEILSTQRESRVNRCKYP